MAGHAAKVQTYYPVIRAPKPGGLAKLNASPFYLVGEVVDTLEAECPLVVDVVFVDASRVGSHQVSLDGPQVFLG
jgi:hypothetical protein